MSRMTSTSEIQAFHKAHQSFFNTNATRPLSWRRHQLKQLIKLLEENYDELSAALNKDLGKTPFEGQVTEIEVTISESKEALACLEKWCAPSSVGAPGVLVPAFCSIRHEPRGVVLIIGPFNYPISTCVGPLVSVFAGGNVAALKPSEMCPATSAAIKRTMPRYFDASVVSVVEGAIPETTDLMSLAWDLVFFTGSERVGTIVAQAAAKTLTPCVLELGGKSPLLVTESPPHLQTMCNRIMWGKTINAGQTCVAPDYVLCHRSVLEPFVQGLKAAAKDMFGDDVKGGGIFSRNVSEFHTQRLVDMVKECEANKKCTIVMGGSKDASVKDRYLAPTIVLMDSPQDVKILKEEIFGCILPIMPYDTEAEAVAYINAMRGTPLAFYCFTTSASQYERLLDKIPSGGTVRNDVLLHFAVSTLPFGGLGTSGYGSAHGIHGFETFTHKRGVLDKPCHPAFEFGGIRYPPYNKYGGMSGATFKVLLRLLPELPPFDGASNLLRKLAGVTAILVAVGVGVARMGGGDGGQIVAQATEAGRRVAHTVGNVAGVIPDWLRKL